MFFTNTPYNTKSAQTSTTILANLDNTKYNILRTTTMISIQRIATQDQMRPQCTGWRCFLGFWARYWGNAT